MAKLKSKVLNAVQNPLYEHSRDHAAVSGLSVAFYTGTAGIVMRTKPKQPHRTSAAQLVQNELWKDGDCMWRHMTWAQKTKWTSFYNQEYRAGRTLYTKRTTTLEAGQQISHKDMGKAALFMSHALRLDLLDYFKNFLESSWVLMSVIDHGETLEVTAGLINPDELTNATALPERLPVRGY